MGRSVAVILALFMFTSGVVFVGSTAHDGAAAPTGPPATLTVNITSPMNGQYFDSGTVKIEWEGNDTATGIWYYEVFLGSLADRYLVGQQTNMTFNGLSEGSHMVIVRGHNNAGQTIDDSVVFYVDYSDPYLQIISPGNNVALNTSDIRLVWQATDPSKITYYQLKLDLRAWITPISPEVTEHTFENVPDGQHTLTVIAYDGAGNSTSRSVSVLVDTVFPKVQILSPANGTGFNHPNVDVIWTALGTDNDIKGFEVWSNGEKLATTTNTTPFFHFAGLMDGLYAVSIRAFDQASNTVEDNVTFLVDTVEPGIVSSQPEGDQVPVDSTVVINFTKPMDHAATDIAIAGVSGALSWDGTALTFTPTAQLAYGTTYTVTMNGKDLVGTPITKSWTFTTTDVGTITGIVLDNNGNPLAGVSVALDQGVSVVTNEQGEFTFSAHAGPHNLTLSKSGWDGKTVPVTVIPGQSVGIASIKVSPSNPLAIYGIIAAVAGVVIVAVLIYMSRRKKEKGPPVARSWKGMDDLQKRANKGRRAKDEEDEEEDLL